MSEITNKNEVKSNPVDPGRLERDLIVKAVHNDPTVFEQWKPYAIEYLRVYRLRENPKINEQALAAPTIEDFNTLLLFEAINQTRGQIFDMDNYMNLETE